MKIAAVIPVKKFSGAKSRLGLPEDTTSQLCKVMLHEVLDSVSKSKIDKIVIISNDEAAFKIGKRHNAAEIFEQDQKGVNSALRLSEKYLLENEFTTSIVLPQDIPLITPQDIADLLYFQKNSKAVLVVPSSKFDGTNALLRSPINVIDTHYDEDSYKIHLKTGKQKNIPTSFVLINRIMYDVDDPQDIQYITSNVEKPALAEKISSIIMEGRK